MKHVLIANLGNRNLKFNGKLYSDILGSESNLLIFNEKLSFRDLTIRIWKHLESDQPINYTIEPNILDSFLTQKEYCFDKIYLIGSNQVNEKKQDQDTFWEAKILQSLLLKNHHITSEIIEYNGNVTNNNQLLIFYKNKLVQLKKSHPESKFIICDAGGTAQQKSSLKIAAEFLFESNQFEVFYKPIDKDALEIVDQYEYRKIILSEQIQTLVGFGNYTGAFELIPVSESDPFWNDLGVLLQFGKLRIDFMYNDISGIGKKSFKKTDVPEILVQYKNKTPLCSPIFTELFGSKIPNLKGKHSFFVSELYYIARFHLNNKNYTEFVLAFAIFIEQFANHYISSHIGIDITGNNQKNRVVMLEFINNQYGIHPLFNYIPTVLSLPVTLSTAGLISVQTDATEAIKVTRILQKLNKFFPEFVVSIDDLRNDIAHRGEGVKKEEIHELFSNNIISQLDEIIGLPPKLPLDNLNDLINQHIKDFN